MLPARNLTRLFAVMGCCWLGIHGSRAAEDFTFFESHIRPALAEHCYECHSAQSGKSKGGLRLDTKEALLKGGENGPAIVPGHPEESRLIQAIRYADDKLQMPPPKKGKLTGSVIADFEQWIRIGAPDPRTNSVSAGPVAKLAEARRRWPFAPRSHPAPPEVKRTDWCRNEVDHFILAKLEEKQLAPAAAADKRTLIRRATYDLTGLPPAPEEVAAFLADESPEAFSRVVDRLLASPEYGERWGRHWLDVVRYADSLDARGVGGEGDISEAYRYRDWVVQSFNDDLPYDKFVLEQIAGDLLPPPKPGGFDTNALIATGVYAIGEWGTGDADKEKMLTDIVDDQIDLTGRAFLGLTLACARCHDHKFDPILNADYYGLAGIFFSSHIIPNPGVKTAGTPVLRIPLASKAEIARKKDLETRVADLNRQDELLKKEGIRGFAVESLTKTAGVLEALWQMRHGGSAATNEIAPALLSAWRDLLGWTDTKLLTKLTHSTGGVSGVDSWHLQNGPDTPSVTINANTVPAGITTLTLPPRSVAAHPSPKGGVLLGWKAPVAGTVSISGMLTDADDKCGDGIEWTVSLNASRGRTELSRGGIENGKSGSFSSVTARVETGDRIELVIGPKGGYECDTTAVYLRIKSGDKSWDLASDVLSAARSNPAPDQFGNPAVWEFCDAAGPNRAGDLLAGSTLELWQKETDSAARAKLAERFQSALMAVAKNPAAQSAEARVFQRFTDPASDIWSRARADLAEVSAELATTVAAIETREQTLRAQIPPPFPVTHGFEDGGTPESAWAGFHDAPIHIRGRYDRLGEIVPRHLPRVLAGDEPLHLRAGTSGRLELARWVASADNPMTARVMVNRIWQHHFGEGIVRTPNNFGKLGVPPTHPELLDYLANRFVESGWSIKAMHRLMMLSAAYQQSSIPDAHTREADPDNLLFGRMNRRRLESEPIRDSLLAASGRLNLAHGGPSIRDLQTDRRTLYVMTIRSDRATYQSLFDAADASAIVDQRINSTVAPQALFLLNNSFVLKQAEGLASRVAGLPADTRARIEWLYERLYARPPVPREIEIGRGALEAEKNDWTAYCQILLSANEFVYID